MNQGLLKIHNLRNVLGLYDLWNNNCQILTITKRVTPNLNDLTFKDKSILFPKVVHWTFLFSVSLYKHGCFT